MVFAIFSIYFNIYHMKFLLKYKLFENLQKSDKILKDNNIQKDEFIFKLEKTLINNGLSSYMGYIVEIILDDYIDYKSNHTGDFLSYGALDKIIDGLKFIKSEGIDISKLNCFDISTFLLKVSDLKDDSIRNKFINSYAPSSLRSDVKSIIKSREGFLFSDRYLTRIGNLTNQNIDLLKKGSRFKTGKEWLNYVEKIFDDDKFSIDELKNSNITIFLEDDEWLIYKPLDFKSYLIPNYKYWCTMQISMFKSYSRLDLIIILNKIDKEKSYVSYVSKKADKEIEVFDYKNRKIDESNYIDIIQSVFKFHIR